jgi:hypothetical protein
MNAEQKRLERQLHDLRDPLPGNPGLLRKYAQFLEGEAHKAADFKGREAKMPGRLVFVSDGALRLHGNMLEVAESYGMARDMLHSAAMAIRDHAGRVEQSQAEHEDTTRRLVNAISRLAP